MSNSIYYVPIIEEEDRTKYVAGQPLKKILTDKFELDNGGFATLTREHLSYFEGLHDADIDGAYTIIEAIKEWGKISIFLRG